MKHLLLTLLIINTATLCAQGQKVTFKKKAKSDLVQSDTLHRHAAYITLSAFNQNIVYEQNIGYGRRNFYFVKFGYGLTQGLFGDQNQTTNVSVGLLTGKNKNNHLEMYVGGALVFNWDGYRNNHGYQQSSFASYLDPYPSFYLGYRHQKPQRPFVFRFGFGYPETLAISAGVSF